MREQAVATCSCDLDLDSMTFIYELDPYSLEIHRICKYELPYVKALESYRLTDIQTHRHDRNHIYHAASQVVNKRTPMGTGSIGVITV